MSRKELGTRLSMSRGFRALDRVGRFRRDRRGSAYVEFAIAGPLFLLLACMVIENGLFLFAQATLDNGTRDGARLIQLGRAANQATFFNQVCADVGKLIPCGSLQYRVQSSDVGFSAMSAMVTTDAGGNMQSQGYSPGASGDFVLVQVGYKRNYLIPWIGRIVSANDTALIVSSYAFQNEPY